MGDRWGRCVLWADARNKTDHQPCFQVGSQGLQVWLSTWMYAGSYLDGGWPTPLKKKNRQLGLLYPIHGKIRFMFQTTNQIYPNMLKPPKIWSILIQFMTEPSRWPWRVVTPKLWVYIYIYYPLVMTNSLLLKMAIEIVIFTMTNGDFSIVMLVYQRVDCIVSCLF